MAHERSETIKIGRRWFNRDTVGVDKGRILGNERGFSTMKEAVTAAKKRSRGFKAPPRIPRRKPKRK